MNFNSLKVVKRAMIKFWEMYRIVSQMSPFTLLLNLLEERKESKKMRSVFREICEISSFRLFFKRFGVFEVPAIPIGMHLKCKLFFFINGKDRDHGMDGNKKMLSSLTSSTKESEVSFTS